MKTNLLHKLTTKVSVKDTNATLEFITLSMQMVSKRAAHFTYDAEKIAIIHKHKYHSSNTQVQLSKKSAQQVLITTQFEELSDNRNQNRGWGIIFLLLVSSFFLPEWALGIVMLSAIFYATMPQILLHRQLKQDHDAIVAFITNSNDQATSLRV